MVCGRFSNTNALTGDSSLCRRKFLSGMRNGKISYLFQDLTGCEPFVVSMMRRFIVNGRDLDLLGSD